MCNLHPLLVVPRQNCQAACSTEDLSRGQQLNFAKEEETDCHKILKFPVRSQVSHNLYNTQDDLSGEGEKNYNYICEKGLRKKKKNPAIWCVENVLELNK